MPFNRPSAVHASAGSDQYTIADLYEHSDRISLPQRDIGEMNTFDGAARRRQATGANEADPRDMKRARTSVR
jgi:hypothetical protein